MISKNSVRAGIGHRFYQPLTVRLIHSTTFGAKSPLLSNESQHSHYAGMSVKSLRKELAKRNMKTGGLKRELLERLASDDIFRHASTTAFATKRPGVTSQDIGDTAVEMSTSTTETGGHSAPREVIPAAIPKPWELSACSEPELPLRVPYLPENDFARYHRHEVVPRVASPIQPKVSTASADAASALSTVVEVVDDTDVAIDDILKPTVGMKEQSGLAGAWDAMKDTFVEILPEIEPRGRNLLTPPTDVGEPMTDTKKLSLQAFSALSLGWFITGPEVLLTGWL